MVYDYVITMKRPDYKFVDQVSQLMYIFSILAFGYFAYLYPDSLIAYLTIIIGILASWIYTIYKKKNKGVAYYRLGLLIAAFGWFINPERNVVMGLLYGLAGLFEKQVKFPKEIGFSSTEIAFNSFPKKRHSWTELNNVVLKDGIITVDFKNNKLVQKEVDQDVSIDIQNEFNQFCQQQLEKVRMNG